MSPDPAARARILEIVAPLIGLPWESRATGPESYDCWGLAAYLQKELMGRDLPLAPSLETDAADPRAVIAAIRRHPLQRQWVPVGRPRHGDVALMRRRREAAHVGVWIDAGPDCRGVLHAVEGGGVMLQDLAQIRALWPGGVEFRRPVSASLEALQAAQAQAEAALEGAEALVVVVRDPINPLFEASFLPVKAGLTPAEILALVPEAERPPGLWMTLGAEPLLRRHPETGSDEWAERRLGLGEILWICPEPPEGDEGSSILAVIAMVVVAVAAPYMAAAIGGAAAGTAASLTTFGKILAAGIAIGGNMLIGAIFQPSTGLDRGPAAPSPTYTASPPGNRLNPGGQIARIYGTVSRHPDLLAPPWGQFADNEHGLHFLLCVGLGRYRINRISIDDTPVWTVEGGYTGSYPSAEIEIVEPGGQVTLFPAGVFSASEIGGQTLAPPAAEEEGGPLVERVVGPFVIVPSGERANRLAFDFACPQGLFKLDDKGREARAAVGLRVQIRAIDDAGAPLGGWLPVVEETLSMATTTPQRFSRAVDVSLDRYEARFIRTTASGVESGRGRDDLMIAGARAFLPGEQRYSEVTALAVRVRADETTQQSSQQWRVDATAILPHWDAASQTWIEGPTEGVEAALLDVLTAPYGLALPEARIDRPALEALAEIWAARGDVCCLAVDQAQSCWDVAEAVGRCGRAAPQVVGGVVTVVRDQPRAFPAQAIGPNDMLRGSLRVTRRHRTTEGPTVVRARYWDRQTRMRDVLCVPPGVTRPREATVDFPGIVDHAQVWREGVYAAAANRHRGTILTFAMLAQGRALRRGDLIRVAHPRPGYGKAAEIVEAAWPRLVLTRPHGIAEGAPQQWLTLTRPDGSPWGPVKAAPDPADPCALIVDGADAVRVVADFALLGGFYSPDPEDWLVSEAKPAAPKAQDGALFPERQAEPTRVLWGPDAGGPVLCVVQGMTPRADGTVEIVAAVESPAVHTADAGSAPAEPAPSGLSPLAGAPVWTGALAVVAEAEGVKAVRVSGPSIPGAVRYDAQLSVDHGATWTAAASSAAPRLEFPAPAAAVLLVRAAAVGALRGPWASWTLDAQTPLWALRAVEGLRRTESGSEPHFAWTASAGAEGYEIELHAGGLLRRVAQTTATAYRYAAALQAEDGGPWASVEIRVRAVRAEERGPWATLSTGAGSPTPPAGFRVTGVFMQVGLAWTPSSDLGVVGYRIILGDPEAPTASRDVAGRLTASAVLARLEPGAHVLRIAARGPPGAPLVWSAPLDLLIDAGGGS